MLDEESLQHNLITEANLSHDYESLFNMIRVQMYNCLLNAMAAAKLGNDAVMRSSLISLDAFNKVLMLPNEAKEAESNKRQNKE